MAFVDPDEIPQEPRNPRYADGTPTTAGSFSNGFIDPDEGMEQQAVYSPTERMGQVMGGAAEIVPKTLGMPVDIARAVLEAGTGIAGMPPAIAPLEEGQKDVGSSDWFMDITNKLGITGYPETRFKEAGEFASMGLGMMAALKNTLGKGTTALIKDAGRSTTKRVAEKMTAPLVTRPGATVTAELAGSGGAALGGELAEEHIGPDWEIVGQFVGGVPTAVLGDLAYSFTKAVVPKIRLNLDKPVPFDVEPGGLVGFGKKVYHGSKKLTDKTTRAAKRLSEISEDPEEALKQMTVSGKRLLPGVKETPAAKTGDKHLMALEQQVINDDPTLYNLVEKQANDNYEVIRNELVKLYKDYPVEIAQAELRKDLDAQIMLLDTSLDKARHKVQVAAALLGPNADRNAVNKITGSIIEEAASKAKIHENQLWSVIDDDLPVSAKSLGGVKDAYKKHIADYLDESLIPSNLKNELGTINADGVLVGGKDIRLNNLGGLKRMRSSVNSAIRGEKAKPDTNWDRVRVLNDFQDEVLDYMRVTGDSELLDTAIGFSRDRNMKFTRGVVGKIRGYDPTGGGRIEPELTLERTVGAGGQKAEVAARQLQDIQEVAGVRVLDEDPSGVLQDYLKHRLNILTPDGKANVSTGTRFLKENESVLRRFPDLKRQVQNTIDLEQSYKQLSKEVTKAKADPSVRKIGNLLEKPPGKFAATVLGTGDGTKQTALVWSKLSPEAKKAMKGDFVKFLELSSRSTPDAEGNFILSGSRMRAMLKDNQGAYNIVLDKGDRARLDQIMTSLGETEFPKAGMPKVEGAMNDVLSQIFKVPARILGAKFGARVAGGGGAGVSLQAAQLGASRAQMLHAKLTPDKAAKLLNDMVLDEDLYISTLKYAAKLRGIESKGFKMPEIPKYSPLHGWMIAAGIDEFQEEAK